MENRKQVGASSSSFTNDLFGPKHPSPPSSSAGIFGSVFGPSSTGLGKDSAHTKYASSSRKLDSESHYGNAKHGVSEYKNQRSKGETGNKYQNEVVEQPCYMSSSIYYGGQEVYSPNTTQSTNSHHTLMKDGRGEDSSGNNTNDASRGNWWQGSLYY